MNFFLLRFIFGWTVPLRIMRLKQKYKRTEIGHNNMHLNYRWVWFSFHAGFKVTLRNLYSHIVIPHRWCKGQKTGSLGMPSETFLSVTLLLVLHSLCGDFNFLTSWCVLILTAEQLGKQLYSTLSPAVCCKRPDLQSVFFWRWEDHITRSRNVVTVSWSVL